MSVLFWISSENYKDFLIILQHAMILITQCYDIINDQIPLGSITLKIKTFSLPLDSLEQKVWNNKYYYQDHHNVWLSLFVHKKSRRDHCETSIKGSIDPDRMSFPCFLILDLLTESELGQVLCVISHFMANYINESMYV